jgi:hypothetical protein
MKFDWLLKSILNRRFSYVFAGFCGVITIMISLWAIDVSVTTINANHCFVEYSELMGETMQAPMILTNGWFIADPYLIYHLAIYMIIFTIIMMAAMIIHATA